MICRRRENAQRSQTNRRQTIRLVTFDLDNTLWAVDAVIRRAEVALNAWLDAHAPAYNRLAVDERIAIRDAVVADDPPIVHDISRLRETVIRKTCEHCGYGAERAAVLAADAFKEFLDWRHRIEFFPNALDVLAELAERYTLAALTDGNADFERLGLDRYFAFGYCAADVGAKKPDPAMFEQALARSGVRPEEAVHIGDNPVADIQGAAAAGMASIWVNLVGAGPVPAASATVTRLKDLPGAVARLDA